jgi:cell division septum initiation protein DivIVA
VVKPKLWNGIPISYYQTLQRKVERQKKQIAALKKALKYAQEHRY